MNAKQYFDDYLPGPKRTVFHTRKGLSWRTTWGVLRYAANNAFIAFVHAAQMKEQVRRVASFWHDPIVSHLHLSSPSAQRAGLLRHNAWTASSAKWALHALTCPLMLHDHAER